MTGPFRTQRFCQALRLDIAVAGKGKDRAPLPAGHLCDDMAGRTKAEDSEMLSVARHHQRAPADQARTQQRGNGDIAARLASGKQ